MARTGAAADLVARPVEASGEPGEVRLERYVHWVAQAAAVRSAYERWALGTEDPEQAFAIYHAELAFEEQAASAYRQSVERVAGT